MSRNRSIQFLCWYGRTNNVAYRAVMLVLQGAFNAARLAGVVAGNSVAVRNPTALGRQPKVLRHLKRVGSERRAG
eukprot:COSAG01_NODE_35320_length_533_cov_7.500000_2_plen_75_part_00